MSPPGSNSVQPEVASGVANLGNTCYMNAVLQALAHAPELCMAVECESHHKNCPISADEVNGTESQKESDQHTNVKKEEDDMSQQPETSQANFCLLTELEKHLIAVHKSGMNSSNGNPAPLETVTPTKFVNGFIQHIAPSFKLGVQEDSHEFLRLLIDAMQKSVVTSRAKQSQNDARIKQEHTIAIKKEEHMDGAKKIKKEDGSESSSTRKSGDEYPFRLFCGKVESVVKCSNCGAKSSTVDPIEDIGLEVNPSSSSYRSGTQSRSTSPLNPLSTSLTDLSTSLKKFITTEHLDNGYKCESCGKVGRATKESKLASVPPILTLHLKRFRYGNEKMALLQAPTPSRRRGPLAGLGVGDVGSSGSAKIEGHVKFDQILDLNPYLTDEQRGQKKRMLCRLFAVIVHTGKNSHSGHYICYVRNIQKNDWWKMDDARVSRVSTQEVFAAEAYMLFYRVVDHPVSIELKLKWKAFQEEEAARLFKLEDEKKKLRIKKEQEEVLAQKEATKRSFASSSIASNKAVAATSNNTTGGSGAGLTTSIGQKRKRDTPELKSGEEWARKLTRKPKAILQTIRAVQEFFSERVRFKPEYEQCMEEEVENQYGITGNGSGAGGGLSLGVSINSDVQNVEDLNGFRHAIWELFNTILPTDPYELEAFLQPKEYKKQINGGTTGVGFVGSGSCGTNGNSEGSSVPVASSSIKGVDVSQADEASVSVKSASTNLIIPVLDQSDSLI